MMPWNGLKLKGQILTGYAFPIIFLAILWGLVLVNVQKVTQLTDKIKQGNKIINQMGEATLHAIRMERSMRGYLVNQKSRHRKTSDLIREIPAVYLEFKPVEEEQIAREQSEYQGAIQSLWAIAAGGTAIASMGALIFGNLIAANVRHRIDRPVSSVATSAHELLTIVTEYEQIGRNQTSAFTELSLTMAQLSGSSQGTATRSQPVAFGVDLKMIVY